MRIRERGLMRRLVAGVATNYAAFGSQMVVLLALTPYVIDRRGAAFYGGYSLVVAITGYLRLLDLGMGPTVARYVARHHDRPADANPVIAASVAASAVIALAATALAVVGLAVATGVADDLRGALLIGVLLAAVQVPMRTFGHVLYGLDRLPARNAFGVLRSVAVLVGTVVAIELGGSLLWVVAVSGVAELLSALGQMSYCFRTVPGLRLPLRAVTRSRLRELTSFSIGVLALSAAAQVVLYGNSVVLGVAGGTTAVALYTVAARLVEGTGLALNQISDVFMPMMSRLDARGDATGSRQVIGRGVVLSVCLAFPAVSALVGLGPGLVHLWVGSSVGDSAAPLALLVIGIAFNAPLRFLVLWAISAGRHGRVGAVAAGESVCTVALSCVLVGPLGVEGVALSTLITFTTTNLVILPPMLLRELHMPTWGSYYRPMAIGAAIVVPATLAVRLGGDGLANAGAITTIAATLTWLVGHAVVLGWVLVPADERRAGIAALASLRRPRLGSGTA